MPKRYFLFALIGFLITSGAFFVSQTNAATASASGISFPVAELGNCTSKDDCHQYCEQPEHMAACLDFAQSHGLQSSSQVATGRKMAQLLQQGQGPGGCKTPDECQTFCSQLSNLDTCLAFAKDHGLDGQNPQIQQGEKIKAYLDAGGKLPGGCDSSESCQSYCSDFSHLQECVSFMKSAGVQPSQSAPSSSASESGTSHGQLSLSQLEKLAQLAASGQTPNGCNSPDTCEQACNGNSANRSQCVAFGEQLGILTSDQAQRLLQTPTGPGGCNSPDACEQYCNDSSHQSECLQFAQDRGFINQQQGQDIQNASVIGRTDLLQQAPPEVQDCIASTVGQQVLDQIRAGQLPSPDDAQKMQSCFKMNDQQGNPRDLFSHLPQQAVDCISGKIGQDAISNIEHGQLPSEDEISTIQSCAQNNQMPPPSPGNHGQPGQSGMGEGQDHGGQMMPPPQCPDGSTNCQPPQGQGEDGQQPSLQNGDNGCVAAGGTPTDSGCQMPPPPQGSNVPPPPSGDQTQQVPPPPGEQESPAPQSSNGSQPPPPSDQAPPPPAAALYEAVQSLLSFLHLNR